MHEIFTTASETAKQTPRPQTKGNAKIEIVDWKDSESSDDQNTGSVSVSLEQLMMGSSNGEAKSKEKLTIDNLWKILASEKTVTESISSRQNASRSRSRNEASQKQDSGIRPKFEVGSIINRPIGVSYSRQSDI